MSAGRTPLDEAVTGGDQDVVRDKLSPNLGKTDLPAEDNSREGGTAKLPSRPTPFKIKGG